MKKFALLVLLIILLATGYFVMVSVQEIKPDLGLLKQDFNGSVVESALASKLFSQEDLSDIQKKYENTDEYITRLNIPDFSPEQDRPKIHAMAGAMYYTQELLEKNEYQKFDFSSAVHIEAIINAYFNSRDPNLLLFIFQAFNSRTELDLTTVLAFAKVYSALQTSLSYVKAELSIEVFVKIKHFIESNAKPEEPISVLKYLLIAQALPFKSNYHNLLEKAKPHLLGAIHKQEGKASLTPEQSAEFSLGLIDFSWQCSLLGTEVPNWLLELTEKEACRLAYRLEQDGCLPTWDRFTQRMNLNEYIYHAYLLFKREDLLYISCNGIPTANAYPPKQLNFNFEEIGLYVYRTGWERNPYMHWYLANKMDDLQMTYDLSSNLISLSLGPVTQLLFEVEGGIKDWPAFKEIFKVTKVDNSNCNCQKPMWEYTLVSNGQKLKLKEISKFYLMNEQGDIRTYEEYFPGSYQESTRRAYEIKIEKDEQGFIQTIFLKGGKK